MARTTNDAGDLGREIVRRIDALGAITETSNHLTRIFLTAEHRAAVDLLLAWMKDAGMAAHLDAIGNVCGRYEGEQAGVPCLMLGSHYDTVRDAGKWDGPLGLVTAISCVGYLYRRGKRLPFAVEVTGFADEEGVRFASTLLGSRAVAGTFDDSVLEARDSGGIRCATPCCGSVSIPAASVPRRGGKASCTPISNCISSRDRCWNAKACRLGW
jgi:allantoate deiminase